MDPGAVLLALLGSPNLASRRAVFEQYDSTVGADTVAGPGRGAAVLRIKGTTKALVATTDGNQAVGALDPWLGAALSVAEATRNVVDHRRAAARRHELPQLRRPDPARGVLAAAARASAASATRAARSACPVTGGNVSLYNESPGRRDRPDARDRRRRAARRRRDARRPGVRADGDAIVLVGEAAPGLAGSAYARARRRRRRGRPAGARPRPRGGAPGVRPRGDRARARRVGAGRVGRRPRRRARRVRDVGRARGAASGCRSPTRRPSSCSARARRGSSLTTPAAPRAGARRCWPASTACRSRRSARSAATGCVIELAGAGATGAAEERGSASPTRSTSRSPTCATPGTTASPAPSAGRRTDLMCGVFGVGRCPAASRPRPRRSPRSGCSRSSTAARSRPASAVSDGEQLMLYKDLGMISSVLDERRLPSLRGDLAIAHCRYSTTGSTVWENAQPTFRLGPRRALAIGHNGNLVNTRELLDQLRGGRARLPASTDTELLTALLADEPAADTVEALLQRPAARPRRVQPRGPRRAAGHRRPRPARLPAARPRPAARAAAGGGADDGLWSGDDAAAGWCLSSETAGARHRRRRVRPRRRARRDRRPRAGPGAALGPLRRRRPRRCACSSSSTSPGPTRTWRAATCTRRAAGWASSSPRAPGRRRPGDARARTPARRPRPATPRRSGIPYREGMVPQPLRRADVHPAVGRRCASAA